ncbi:ferric-dicitrate binding protein FerR (iron transport regulator) [Dyadobacter jejuensis]|uniref:Ferric-dicitrate binding protein FerR (Iron transport regulator) n=1 Tax=Dyadobacter jejuensis TaxID=1082580 RepID=A0A316APP1_9BACT|nr:FecR domain-containing protein [Dyadobacter jejuensis]PWJ59386.1 ferric-dicitrate binding protein FerR (iron transport regulator) [Dyadobacter jejuensis]
MKTTISKYIFFDYLSGRSNPLERKLVEEWIRNSENLECYYGWLMEWETRYPQFIPDQQQALERLQYRVTHEMDAVPLEEEEPEESSNFWQWPFLYHPFLGVAVALVLVLGIGVWFGDSLWYKDYRTGYGQTTNIYLEDGSRVSLNANSSLKVPRIGFYGKVRKVLLEGEAEFAVSHTLDHQQFVVQTSDTFQVQVLGTEFSVLARPRATEVALKSGSVRIAYTEKAKNKGVTMKPGDLAKLNPHGGVQILKQPDPDAFGAWKEQRYVFNATSVREVSQMIRDNYGLTVVARKDILDRKITGNFKTKDVDELLKTISEVLNLRVEPVKDDTIQISNF